MASGQVYLQPCVCTSSVSIHGLNYVAKVTLPILPSRVCAAEPDGAGSRRGRRRGKNKPGPFSCPLFPCFPPMSRQSSGQRYKVLARLKGNSLSWLAILVSRRE